MSTLNKMSIRGIRSFGTAKEDEQKITFTSPLTLIVGENGCGKTTLIECLKYATTGETPPGSSSGKTFIHDPNIFNMPSSLGQVKLQITDIMGKNITCIRSIKSEMVKGKAKFSTLDSTVITEDATSKGDPVHCRVEEANVLMCNAMGVSKAILNNVIFCHQEDSAWPMDEGQKLKQKFDAIFGTTEYNKAIDKIIKLRKGFVDKKKICETQKKHLLEAKKEAEKKQLDFDLLEEKYKKMDKEIEDLEKLLAPIDEKMVALLTKEKNYVELHGKRGGFEATISNCRTNEESTRARIKEFLEGSVETLQEQLRNFSLSQKTREEVLNKLESEQKKLESDERELIESEIKDKAKVDLFTDHLGQMQELIEQRVKAIKALCELLDLNLGIDLESQSLSVEDLGSSLHRIQRAISEKEEEFGNIQAEDEANQVEIQLKIDKVREEKTKAETNLATQAQRIKILGTTRDKTKREIDSIERSLPNLGKVDEQIEAAEKELKKVQQENDIEELENERICIEADKNELETNTATLEKDVEMLDSISKVTSELESKQREASKDQKDFERIKNKNSATLKKLFPGKIIEKVFKETVNKFNENLLQEVKGLKAELQSAKMNESRTQADREHLRKQQKLKKKDLDEAQEKVEEITDGGDFMELLTSQNEKVNKLNMDLALHKSSESTFSYNVKSLEQDPCCPLCHKNLDDHEKDELKDEIKAKIRQLPSRINETEKKLKIEVEKMSKINECKASFDSIEKLKLEVKKLNEDLSKSEVEFRENSSKIEDLELQIVEPEEKLSLMTGSFLSDMVKLDELLKGISTKSKEIEELKAKLPEEIPQKSLSEAKNELRQLNLQIKSKNEVIKTLTAKINAAQSKRNELQVKINKLNSMKMENEKKVQGLDQMRKQLIEMEKEKLELERKSKEDSAKLQPITEKLKKLSTEKDETKKKASKRNSKIQIEINEFKNCQKDIDRQSSDIETYEKMNLVEKLKDLEMKIDEANESLKVKKDEKKKKSSEIERVNKEIGDQEGIKRNLEDNLELRKIELQLKEAKIELEKLNKMMGDMDPKKLMKEKNELRERRDTIHAKQMTLRGQLKESKDRIEAAEEELNQKKYKNAKRNYLDECINEQVLKAMIGDLHKYRAALERALLKFHADKMVQINQSIRDYWNNIYKGNDIDYILIKTDEEQVKAASDKKRSYSYRVVQCKNGGSEIDMRGRCSAGQKVLASLIIRMALADTFAANCGVLALDEPTTNLDQNNIQSLCAALSAIIYEREKMGNFMLLVITHDMEFTHTLENTCHYFKLSRDAMGKSRIEKMISNN